MLELPQVTLAIADCVNFKAAFGTMRHCANLCLFADLKFFTHEPYTHKHIVAINKINSLAEYSHFMVKELGKYITTDFVLVVQVDGFIVNPDRWNPDFLKYDYIGPPWHEDQVIDPQFRVGNGGFSLRSKKLQDFLASDDKIVKTHPEDAVICQVYRPYLESKGFKFAPLELAHQFGNENYHWDGKSFGQHQHFVLHPLRNKLKIVEG